MPLYDYQCTKCKHKEEDVWTTMTDDKARKCPKCQKVTLSRSYGVFKVIKGGPTPKFHPKR